MDTCCTQTFKIDEDVIADCLALNFPTRVTRDQLIAQLQRREIHPLRVAYDLILDHKNAKSRIDGERSDTTLVFFCGAVSSNTHVSRVCDRSELRNVKIVSSKPKTFVPSEPSTLLLPGA